MGLYLNPNNFLLKKSLNSPIYVDKSMIIEQLDKLIETNDNLICVSRPRRFGKTMTATLISAFYSKGCDSRELFSNLKIAKTPSWDKNLNKFNVIQIDVQGILCSTEPENLVHKINIKINKELIKAFPEVDIGIKDCLSDSLVNIYSTTGEQFIIIMDEYDVLVREQVSDKILNKYLLFLSSLFKNNNLRPAIHLAYLTGILPIVHNEMQNKLNKIKEDTIINPYILGSFIGFTEEEVKDLCNKCNMDFPECRHWYNGYKIEENLSIYNPVSIRDAMDFHEYDRYWTNTGSYEIITDCLKYNFDGLRDDVITLMGNKAVSVDVSTYVNKFNTFKSKDDIFTFLIHLGYLTYDKKTKECWIPNNEIRSDWINAIRLLPEYSNIIEIIKGNSTLFEDTIELNETAVVEAINKAHIVVTNSKTYNNEKALQLVISLAYFYAYEEYSIIQELPTGKGYADVVFIPVHPEQNRPAFIVELKNNKTTETALTKIKQKQYGKNLSNYTGDILFIGINFDEDSKEHICKIEKFHK